MPINVQRLCIMLLRTLNTIPVYIYVYIIEYRVQYNNIMYSGSNNNNNNSNSNGGGARAHTSLSPARTHARSAFDGPYDAVCVGLAHARPSPRMSTCVPWALSSVLVPAQNKKQLRSQPPAGVGVIFLSAPCKRVKNVVNARTWSQSGWESIRRVVVVVVGSAATVTSNDTRSTATAVVVFYFNSSQ